MSSVLVDGFRRNSSYLDQRIAHLTHEQSLTQIGGAANCVNWLVGHMINYRHVVLAAAKADPSGIERFERYARESDPILSDGPGVLPFSTLVEELKASAEAVAAALGSIEQSVLADPSDRPDRFATGHDQMHFYLFHDTLHTGQADVAASLSI